MYINNIQNINMPSKADMLNLSTEQIIEKAVEKADEFSYGKDGTGHSTIQDLKKAINIRTNILKELPDSLEKVYVLARQAQDTAALKKLLKHISLIK